MLPHGEMCFSEEGILTKDELRQCCAGDARRGKEIEKASPVSCLGLTFHILIHIYTGLRKWKGEFYSP